MIYENRTLFYHGFYMFYLQNEIHLNFVLKHRKVRPPILYEMLHGDLNAIC